VKTGSGKTGNAAVKTFQNRVGAGLLKTKKRNNAQTNQKKGKLLKKKRKHPKLPAVRSKPGPVPRQEEATCSTNETSVSDDCLQDAMTSLLYEQKQVTNYLKQKSRLVNHAKIQTNKLNKNDEFESAAKHMLWAIGGNISNPLCGQDGGQINSSSNSTSNSTRSSRALADSIETYNLLMNCSNSIAEACDLDNLNGTYNHSDHTDTFEQCETYKNDFKVVSAECISTKDQTNGTLQCECWAKAAKDVKEIKALKCDTKSEAKIVTAQKRKCIEAFGKCKKLEDSAVGLIHKCMHDHSNVFINMSDKVLNEQLLKDLSKSFPILDLSSSL